MRILGAGERGRRGGRGRGLTCVVPRPAPAPDSPPKPQIPGAVRVRQRCPELGSSEAARRCSSPSRPRPRPPPRTGRAAARLAAQTWSSLSGPAGRNLGPSGRQAASRSRSWSPAAAGASGSSGAGETAPAGSPEFSRGHGGNLPQCLERGLRRGWRRRAPGAAACSRRDPSRVRTEGLAHGPYLTFQSGFLGGGR